MNRQCRINVTSFVSFPCLLLNLFLSLHTGRVWLDGDDVEAIYLCWRWWSLQPPAKIFWSSGKKTAGVNKDGSIDGKSGVLLCISSICAFEVVVMAGLVAAECEWCCSGGVASAWLAGCWVCIKWSQTYLLPRPKLKRKHYRFLLASSLSSKEASPDWGEMLSQWRVEVIGAFWVTCSDRRRWV